MKTTEQKAAKKLALKEKKLAAFAALNNNKGLNKIVFCPVYESQSQYQDVLYQDYVNG